MSAFPDLLIERGMLGPNDLARAEEVRRHTGGRLPATLTRLGLLSETDLVQILSAVTGRAVATRDDFPKTQVEIEGLNRRFLARHTIVPIALESGCLTVAMADPEDEGAIEALHFAAEVDEVVAMLATFSDIEAALDTESFEEDDVAPFDELSGAGSMEDMERLLEGESDAPIIRLVQRLLTNAVNRRASDVHIEPMARHLSIRYRIDGRLIEIERHPDSFANPIASRIKVMAGLDIAESRLPQDGRLKLTVRGRDVDVRVATSPIAYGESIVMRLLGRSEVPLDLERLGLPDAALARLERALDRPHGIILLTGPTGSGKTTTLYAAINRLRRPEVKILTVEDPVEVLLEGVNQVQVRAEIGLSYAATLRAFLRQDPDILMIGEIRDHETAEIAMRAALTGHLVLSTLHTNSALGAFTRLADIGIEPYLTASTVIATIAQRLIRALCVDCRQPREPTAPERDAFVKAGMSPPSHLHDAIGCSRCDQSGFRGRTPLIEILEVDEALREQIRDGNTEALMDGHRAGQIPPDQTLYGHGLALVAAGRTTLNEVERAVQLG
jgi:general secretion pathway protein E